MRSSDSATTVSEAANVVEVDWEGSVETEGAKMIRYEVTHLINQTNHIGCSHC